MPGGKEKTVHERRTLTEQSEEVIRLALVDDQTMFREGLRALLDQEPDLEVVAQSTGVKGLQSLDVEPHVVVTDLTFPD
ncbi:MAG TPA: DNA-binding response regulator, partial [Acidimicrobiia bacterium]|nr:DNA-binding response regulator [Acidimicrobiia bacterium]